MMWAGIIHYNLVGAHENGGSTGCFRATKDDNDGLISPSGVVSKRLCALGNWSKFVRPGWVMIGATNNPQSGVQVSAFKNPSSGAFAIVAVNSNGSSVSHAVQSERPFGQLRDTEPHDAKNNLAGQSAIPVSGRLRPAFFAFSSNIENQEGCWLSIGLALE